MNPHLQTPLIHHGAPIGVPGAATILVHGRGQEPATMLDIARRIDLPTMPYLALQAADHTWYPKSFLAPVAENQPYLDYALERLDRTVDYLHASGYSSKQIIFVGFSQGACLSCEYVRRRPARWGGLVSFTGGLIGSQIGKPGAALNGTPILITGSETDEFVPLQRMKDSAALFQRMDAIVREQYYPDAEHHVNDAQIGEARALMGLAQYLAPGMARPLCPETSMNG
ncbi:MAG: alpha/beta hydrolase [Noviherbaspirillum sp.]